MHNASDEKKVKEKQTHSDLAREQELEDIRSIMATPEGQRFFKRFFKWGKIASVSMTGNSWTYFHEGHKNCAMRIWQDLCMAVPNESAKMFVELTLEAMEEKE